MNKEILLKLGLNDQQINEVLKLNSQSLNKVKLQFGVENALIKNKAKNVKAVSALINLDDIVFDENGVSGIDEQIKALKESQETAFLFYSDEEKKPDVVGAKPEEGKDKNKHKDIRKMTYTEMCKFFEGE